MWVAVIPPIICNNQRCLLSVAILILHLWNRCTLPDGFCPKNGTFFPTLNRFQSSGSIQPPGNVTAFYLDEYRKKSRRLSPIFNFISIMRLLNEKFDCLSRSNERLETEFPKRWPEG